MKISEKKLFIIVSLILLLMILFSFFQITNSSESLTKYDAISVFFYIICVDILRILPFLIPILIMIISIYEVHKELHSGFIKYQIIRMGYKKYFKKKIFQILKYIWIVPTVIFILFIMCILYTKNFNFENIIPKIIGYTESGEPLYLGTIGGVSESFYKTPVALMIVYFTVILLHCIMYANIAFIVCKKNKNFLVTILQSFLVFMGIAIVSQIGLGTIFSKYLSIKVLRDVFNIVGIWAYYDIESFWAVLIYSIILASLSILASYLTYKNKEKVLLECEK